MKDEQDNTIEHFEMVSEDEMSPTEADDLAEMIARFILDLIRQRAEQSFDKSASDQNTVPTDQNLLDL